MSLTSIQRGVFLALGAAVLFGATTPVLERAARDAEPISAGALLYLGAGLAGLLAALFRRRPAQAAHAHPLDHAHPHPEPAPDPHAREAALARGSLGRIAAMALCGACVAPVALFFGLRELDAASASLLLTLEAPFTLVLARLFFSEHLGGRVLGGAALVTLGGALLAGVPATAGAWSGALLVIGAALAWGADNTLSRGVAHLDPLAIVAAKGLLGGGVSAVAALLLGARWPALGPALVLLGAGALGYGVSLVWYLGAQRRMGAARTASVFAAAPFVGVAASLAFGANPDPLLFGVAAAAIALGIWLHATEHHAHAHTHEPLAHDHAHSHDDGHHDHRHERLPTGPHAHPHEHGPLTHEHEHADDLHHAHH